jgi:hypothetical protein
MHSVREAEDPRFTPVRRRADLLAEGWNDKAIKAMVASGQLVRVRHGAYASRSAWIQAGPVGQHEIRARAVLQQGKSDLVLSHNTGGAVWEIPFWDTELDVVDVTRRDGRSGRKEAGVRQHRGKLLDDDVVVRHGIPVVGATRLGLELTLVNPVEQALSYVNHLLHVGATSKDELNARYRNSMDRWPNSLSTDLVLRLAQPDFESVAESRSYYLCWRQHLPLPVPQYPVYDNGALFARLDFAWPELGAWLEFDGKVKYAALVPEGQSASDVVVREKQREDRIRELTGWRCVRITWADLYRPEATALRIRRALFPAAAA